MISSKLALVGVGILIFLTCSSASPLAKEKKVTFTLLALFSVTSLNLRRGRKEEEMVHVLKRNVATAGSL